MRSRFVILILFAMLPAMPMSLPVTAAPMPKSKYPTIYALVYVGNGTNDRENLRKIKEKAENLRELCNPRFRGNFRVQLMEETAVLRVWYAIDTPEKQAEIINHVVDNYLRLVPSRRKLLDEVLRDQKRRGWEKHIKWTEEELRNLPRLVERAAAPKRRP